MGYYHQPGFPHVDGAVNFALHDGDERANEVVLVPFEIATIHGANVSGEVDVLNAKHVWSFLDAATAGRTSFIVSLEHCSYFDSSGLALLIRLRKRIGPGLVLVVPEDAYVRKILNVTGLASKIRIADSLAQAVRELTAG